jgi:hypothetical protein
MSGGRGSTSGITNTGRGTSSGITNTGRGTSSGITNTGRGTSSGITNTGRGESVTGGCSAALPHWPGRIRAAQAGALSMPCDGRGVRSRSGRRGRRCGGVAWIRASARPSCLAPGGRLGGVMFAVPGRREIRSHDPRPAESSLSLASSRGARPSSPSSALSTRASLLAGVIARRTGSTMRPDFAWVDGARMDG